MRRAGNSSRKYAAGIVSDPEPVHRATQEQIKRYVLAQLSVKDGGVKPRVLLLVFKGEDAVMKVRSTVGHIVNERTSGETIRDTYGDYVVDAHGDVTYFEPAVLAPPTAVSPRNRDLNYSQSIPTATAACSMARFPSHPAEG
jgi:hypothetical protein